MDYLIIADLRLQIVGKGIDLAVPQTNLKPSEAGSNLRGGATKRYAVFDDGDKLTAKTE